MLHCCQSLSIALWSQLQIPSRVHYKVCKLGRNVAYTREISSVKKCILKVKSHCQNARKLTMYNGNTGNWLNYYSNGRVCSVLIWSKNYDKFKKKTIKIQLQPVHWTFTTAYRVCPSLTSIVFRPLEICRN